MGRLSRKLSSSQIIILGFAAAILFGSLLLMLPISTRDGRGACFTDALFTATSAVCVTGLVVRDTATGEIICDMAGQDSFVLCRGARGAGATSTSPPPPGRCPTLPRRGCPDRSGT